MPIQFNPVQGDPSVKNHDLSNPKEKKGNEIDDSGKGDKFTQSTKPDGGIGTNKVPKNNPLLSSSSPKSKLKSKEYDLGDTVIVGDPYVDAFVDKVIEDASETNGETAEVILVADTSRSMEFGVYLIMKGILTLTEQLKNEGYEKIEVGLVTFNDQLSVYKRLPLTEMNEEGIKKLLDTLGYIKFEGGIEPVGAGAEMALSMIGKAEEGVFKKIVVITDSEGIKDDNKGCPYVDSVEEDASSQGIGFELHIIKDEDKRYVNLPVVAATQDYLLELEKGNLKSCFNKYNSEISLEVAKHFINSDNFDLGVEILNMLVGSSVDKKVRGILFGYADDYNISVLRRPELVKEYHLNKIGIFKELALLGSPEGTKSLQNLINDSKFKVVREKAKKALAEIAD